MTASADSIGKHQQVLAELELLSASCFSSDNSHDGMHASTHWSLFHVLATGSLHVPVLVCFNIEAAWPVAQLLHVLLEASLHSDHQAAVILQMVAMLSKFCMAGLIRTKSNSSILKFLLMVCKLMSEQNGLH